MVSVNYLAYKNALKQAWKDGKMSADESAMLDTLRKSLNISPEEHLKIEHDVRNELANAPSGANDQSLVSEEPAPPPQLDIPPDEPGEGQVTNQTLEATDTSGAIETDDINELLLAGKNSYHKGNYEEAIEYCDKVLLLDPDNSEALFFRKRTLSKIEKLRGPEQAGVAKPGVETENTEETEKAPVKSSKVSKPEAGVAGAGDPDCKSCGGSGQCHWCKGSGECYWCKGSSKCEKCGGSGSIGDEQCKSCKGSGKCSSCTGTGKCYWCNGSGKCSKCSM